MNAKPTAYPIMGHKRSKESVGFEPTGLAVKRMFGKKLRRPKQPANLSLLSKRPEPLYF